MERMPFINMDGWMDEAFYKQMDGWKEQAVINVL